LKEAFRKPLSLCLSGVLFVTGKSERPSIYIYINIIYIYIYIYPGCCS